MARRGPPASALSAVTPVRVSVSTVVVRSGGAEMADGAVLHAEGCGEDGDSGEPAVPGEGQLAGAGEHGDQAENDRFPGECSGQPATRPGGGKGMRGPAAGQRAEDEPGDRDHRGSSGQAGAGS